MSAAHARFRHPAVDATLSTAARLLGMDVVFIGGLDDTTFRFLRVRGEWPGLREGLALDRDGSLCHRMLDGGSRVATFPDPSASDVPVARDFGIGCYVGAPIRDVDDHVAGTLCGIAPEAREIATDKVELLDELARVLGRSLPADDGVVIRRTPDGWLVDGTTVGDTGDVVDDLTTAMVLADLLQGELRPSGRPPRPPEGLDELTRLRVAVGQLEHALAARVTVEQAIGVLAERLSVPPREAFDRLRRVARRSGRRVHDLSGEVVRSTGGALGTLPPELRGARR